MDIINKHLNAISLELNSSNKNIDKSLLSMLSKFLILWCNCSSIPFPDIHAADAKPIFEKSFSDFTLNKSFINQDETFYINIEGTYNVAKACKLHNKPLIFISTC